MALTNNDIIKKLRVALKLRDDEIVDILALVDFRIPKVNSEPFFEKKRTQTTWNCKIRY